MMQANIAPNPNWVIANWKMNPATGMEAQALLEDLTKKCEAANSRQLPHIAIAPSFLHVNLVSDFAGRLPITLSAQNVCGHNASHGAFTGEISAKQLADSGVQSVIIGHSERRQYFTESNKLLAKKIENVLANDLTVIFCIGESHEQYLVKQTVAVIKQQLGVLAQFAPQISTNNQTDAVIMPKLLVAYEPIWAIGTGLTPTREEIAEIHRVIRESLNAMTLDTPILYGGSVNAKNVADIARIDLVDGVLVGGASLDAESFWQIVTAFSNQ